MLKASGDNSGCNAHPCGESANSCNAEIAVSAKDLVIIRWNEQFLCKGVCLRFAWISISVALVEGFDENRTFAMFHYMPGFMEKREPQLVIGLSSQAQLN